jgi:hypothetical protein
MSKLPIRKYDEKYFCEIVKWIGDYKKLSITVIKNSHGNVLKILNFAEVILTEAGDLKPDVKRVMAIYFSHHYDIEIEWEKD